jgi:hypothetical protein
MFIQHATNIIKFIQHATEYKICVSSYIKHTNKYIYSMHRYFVN